jgi:hypothetical protein
MVMTDDETEMPAGFVDPLLDELPDSQPPESFESQQDGSQDWWREDVVPATEYQVGSDDSDSPPMGTPVSVSVRARSVRASQPAARFSPGVTVHMPRAASKAKAAKEPKRGVQGPRKRAKKGGEPSAAAGRENMTAPMVRLGLCRFCGIERLGGRRWILTCGWTCVPCGLPFNSPGVSATWSPMVVCIGSRTSAEAAAAA